MEDQKNNKEIQTEQIEEDQELKFDKLINSVFKDKSKKTELIEKLRLLFLI